MAVQDGPTEKRYALNGVTNAFTIPFLLLAASDLDVLIDGIQVTSGYTLAGVGNPTSTITFTTPPIGSQLLLQLDVPFERLTDYQENGDFLADTVNRDYDRIWQALKQLLRFSTRALTLGVFDVDGAGFYRAKGNGIRGLASANGVADAAVNFKDMSDYIALIVGAGQGPINSAANVLYVGPDGLTYNLQDLRNITDPLKGAALIGRGVVAVESIKDLLTAGRYGNQIAIVKSYFPSMDMGGDCFRWSATTPKSAHDGGKFISPTVPWDGTSASLGSFLNAVGEVQPQGSGCWIRMSKFTFGTDYGMTPASASEALAKLISTGGRKQIPDGVFKLNTAISLDFSNIANFPEPADPSPRFTLEGQSISNSIFNYSGVGYALTLIGAPNTGFGQSIHSMIQLSKFALKPANAGFRTCNGIRLTNHAYTSLQDISLEYLGFGLDLNSVITCDFERLYLRNCEVGLYVRGAGFSMPNANDFRRLTCQGNSFAGIVANKIGGGFHIQGATIESNGTMGTPGTGGFVGNLDGVNGSATLNLTNVYFEANLGDADLLLTNTSEFTVTVVLTNVNFNRVNPDACTKNNIGLSNTGGGRIRLILNGVSFMRGGTYTPTAARPYIVHDAACEVIDNGSTYSDAIEIAHAVTSAPVTSGSVASNGSAISVPSGITTSKLSTGTYEIVSPLGWGIDATRYFAWAVCTNSAGGVKVERVAQNSATSFTVVLTNNAGALTDSSFNFFSTRQG